MQLTNDKESVRSRMEHTLLGENLTRESVLNHIQEALTLEVFGVCLPLEWVSLAKKTIGDNTLKIVTVVDFPLGQKPPHEKVLQALAAKSFGAHEIDMVMDYQALKRCQYQKVLDGISAVVQNSSGMLVKVIIETSALTKEEIAIASSLVCLSGAHCVKTSTGFHDGGAKIEDIKLISSLLPENMLIKASGGIRDFKTAKAMIEAGAHRIGASKSANILNPI